MTTALLNLTPSATAGDYMQQLSLLQKYATIVLAVRGLLEKRPSQQRAEDYAKALRGMHEAYDDVVRSAENLAAAASTRALQVAHNVKVAGVEIKRLDAPATPGAPWHLALTAWLLPLAIVYAAYAAMQGLPLVVAGLLVAIVAYRRLQRRVDALERAAISDFERRSQLSARIAELGRLLGVEEHSVKPALIAALAARYDKDEAARKAAKSSARLGAAVVGAVCASGYSSGYHNDASGGSDGPSALHDALEPMRMHAVNYDGTPMYDDNIDMRGNAYGTTDSWSSGSSWDCGGVCDTGWSSTTID